MIDPNATTVEFFGRTYALPNTTGELDTFNSNRISVLLTGEKFPPETIECYIDGDSLDKYLNDYRDPDAVYSGVVVALCQNTRIKYGTVVPIQFNGADAPAVKLDHLAESNIPANLHPLIMARVQELKAERMAANRADIAATLTGNNGTLLGKE